MGGATREARQPRPEPDLRLPRRLSRDDEVARGCLQTALPKLPSSLRDKQVHGSS